MRDIALSLTSSVESVSLHHYDHWYSNEQNASLLSELKKIKTLLPSKEAYIFLGKSLGVDLALSSIKSHKNHPVACIFIGTGVYSDAPPKKDKVSLKGHSVPTLFIQNTRDPRGSYAELVQTIKKHGVKNASLYEAGGKGNDYENIPEITREVIRFLDKNKLFRT